MADVTAIQDRSQTSLSEIKRHLRLDPDDDSEDLDLEDYLAEAKSAADAYCGNNFLTSTGAEKEIPRFIEGWIKRKVASLYTFRESVVESVAASGAIGQIRLTEEDKRDLFPGWKPRI